MTTEASKDKCSVIEFCQYLYFPHQWSALTCMKQDILRLGFPSWAETSLSSALYL